MSCKGTEIYKYLGNPINVRKEESFKKSGKNKTGSVVNSTIEELKQELDQDKAKRRKDA